jgi:uncharacterized membrane protein
VLASAVAFSDFVLAIHILAVVVAFGATFAYPLIFAAAFKADPKVVPWLFTVVRRIDRYIVNPGLAVVLLAGIYLASDLHQWGSFYVQWGLGAVIVIGAGVGSYMIPREGKLAEVAERDLAAVGAGASAASPPWSEEFRALQKQVAIGGAILDLIVVVTIFLMATHAGGS